MYCMHVRSKQYVLNGIGLADLGRHERNRGLKKEDVEVKRAQLYNTRNSARKCVYEVYGTSGR